MAKNLYLCLINLNTSADMVIEAESLDEAKEIAEKLADNGKGDMTMSELGSAEVSDVHLIEFPESADKKQAQENADAWKEYREEEQE